MLVASQVLIANEKGGDELNAIVLAAALVLLAIGAGLTRRLAGWIAVAGFVAALGSLAVMVATGLTGSTGDIASSLLTLAAAGGVAALCALRGGDWGAAAALAALGQLVLMPWSALTEVPFERLSELCARHHGALGVVLQLAVGLGACSAAAKRA